MASMNLKSSSKTKSHTTGQNKEETDCFKLCNECKEYKDIDRFEYLNGARRYRYNRCRTCRNRGRRKGQSKSPKRFISYLYTGIRNKRAKTHVFTITREELQAKYEEQKGCCAISGMPMTFIKDGTGNHGTNISVDRRDNETGYTKENVWLVCHIVNMMKHTMDLEDLLEWSELIYMNRKQL